MKKNNVNSNQIEETGKALKESEEKYRTLVENINIGVYRNTGGPHGRFLHANPAIAKMFGYDTVEEFMKTPVSSLYQNPDERKLFISEILSQGFVKNKELKLKKKDGTPFWGSCFAQIKFNDKGEIEWMDGVIEDISERKRLEEELKRSNTDLEQFAYVASHDLKTPLQTIASYTQLLVECYQGKLDSDADNFIHIILDGIFRMGAIIDDLLSYSRVDIQGKEFEIVDCHESLKQSLANLQTMIKENDAIITSDLLPNIKGEPLLVYQLFQNLIGNAVKFRKNNRPEIHVGAEKKENEWLFSVSDNGIGIDPKCYEQIFIAFKRLHDQKEYSGTGVGLAICKKIVERHGGRIWVDSKPGKGSTFYFTIPDTGDNQLNME